MKCRFDAVLAMFALALLPIPACSTSAAPEDVVEQPDVEYPDMIVGDTGPVIPAPGEMPTLSGVDFAAFPELPDFGAAPTGATFHVAVTGDDVNPGTEAAPMRTIVAAVRAAAGGDRVVVHAGTYREGDEESGYGVNLNKAGLTLMAAPGEDVRIEPADGYTYGVRVVADGTILHGITVAGFESVCIELGGDGTTLSDAVLSDVTVEAVAEGIINYEDLNNQPDVLSAEGLTPSVSGLLLDNVSIFNARALGFSCNSGPCVGVRFNHVRVRNAGVAGGNSGADCIAFERGDNLVFFDVEATGCEADGLDLKATRVLVQNSYFHNVIRNGLKLWRGGDVINTIVSHTGGDAGVVFDGPGRYRIIHSVVAFHVEGTVGAYTMTTGYDSDCGVTDAACGASTGAANCCRTNNLAANWAGLLEVEISNSVFLHGSGPLFLPTLSGVTLRNNMFGTFAEGEQVLDVRDIGEQGERVSIATAQSGGHGSGNLAWGTDPGLPDLSTRPADEKRVQWIPGTGSPLIDGGVADPDDYYPLIDVTGAARQAGTAPDIGPFEVL